jgi:hypothetical protein
VETDSDRVGPPCGHAGCRREADYRIERPGAADRLRCRWHADAAWRPHGAAARVVALHGEVPAIQTTAGRRRTLLPALLLFVALVVVVLGFAVIAPLMV